MKCDVHNRDRGPATFCNQMNGTENNQTRTTSLGALLGVVLCQHAVLYLAARRFAELLASAGFSLSLPTLTALVLQKPWLLAFTAATITACSGWAMSRRASPSHAKCVIVALAVIAASFHFFSLIVFLMPLMGGIIGRIE